MIFFVCIGIFLLLVLLIVTTYMVYAHCSRPTYPEERKKILLKNKDILIHTHNAEPFSCKTYDNVIVSGFIVQRPHAQRIILLCHGYHHSKEFMMPVLEMFPNDTIILFDFRAHGDSEGNLISFSIHESKDIHAVIHYIHAQEELRNLPIYGIGVSMGAATLIKAAHEGAPFEKIVIDSSFAELRTQLTRTWKHKTRLPQFLSAITLFIHEKIAGISLNEASLKNMVPTLSMPVYIIHANKDWLIPVEDAFALYNAVQAQKELWIIDSASHARNFTERPYEYKERIDAFFDSVTL